MESLLIRGRKKLTRRKKCRVAVVGVDCRVKGGYMFKTLSPDSRCRKNAGNS